MGAGIRTGRATDPSTVSDVWAAAAARPRSYSGSRGWCDGHHGGAFWRYHQEESRWPIPFNKIMTPATTREYKEKGSHDELRIEHHNTREWNKDKRILRRNTKRATDEERDWGKGEVIERLMWATWKGNKRLIWVHKIIKQVQGGWKIDMRETTRNSKEATRDKIEAQGKKEARMLDMENSSDWTRKCPRDSDGPEQL